MRTPFKRTLLRHASSIVVPCVVVCMGSVACASAAPFNPDQLATGQVDRVAAICQNVMGLDPAEPETWGIHTGVANLDNWTSHYRGCVFSLSNSLTSVNAERATSEAAQACRAKGLEPGSPDLAVCVLQAAEAAPIPAATSTVTSGSEPPDHGLTPASGSFYNASHRELSQREALACAELGLEPASSPFASCVRNLKATFFAIDNPVN